MIIKTLTLGPIETNCYVVADEKSLRCAVIDPAADASVIMEYIETAGLTCDCILLTHAHFDHTGAVEDMLEETGAPLYMSKKDDGVAIGSWGDVFNAPEGTKFLKDGDIINVGNVVIAVMETPGHTPGCLTYMATQEGEESKVLFTGDTLFKDSCGRTDFPASDMEAMLNSLRRLGHLPGDYEVYPGHMWSTTMERERRTNQFLRYGMYR